MWIERQVHGDDGSQVEAKRCRDLLLGFRLCYVVVLAPPQCVCSKRVRSQYKNLYSRPNPDRQTQLCFPHPHRVLNLLRVFVRVNLYVFEMLLRINGDAMGLRYVYNPVCIATSDRCPLLCKQAWRSGGRTLQNFIHSLTRAHSVTLSASTHPASEASVPPFYVPT